MKQQNNISKYRTAHSLKEFSAWFLSWICTTGRFVTDLNPSLKLWSKNFSSESSFGLTPWRYWFACLKFVLLVSWRSIKCVLIWFELKSLHTLYELSAIPTPATTDNSTLIALDFQYTKSSSRYMYSQSRQYHFTDVPKTFSPIPNTINDIHTSVFIHRIILQSIQARSFTSATNKRENGFATTCKFNKGARMFTEPFPNRSQVRQYSFTDLYTPDHQIMS